MRRAQKRNNLYKIAVKIKNTMPYSISSTIYTNYSLSLSFNLDIFWMFNLVAHFIGDKSHPLKPVL